MIAINWPLFILPDSPEFPRKLTVARMVKMCENEAKVTNRSFDGNGETCIHPIQIFFCHLNTIFLYLEVNLMPHGFLF